ncbi:MAG TPA: periplasmic heavy metal sensor [Acidocella sp.]|jgi:hypothetical protein|uniref:periplasmic heavy metal sensor n=1 Tax=Acidocella sp. TaxID=50710 RepID=UPI002BA29228|nr:periplasmic heavy metal sensor [Acidocella sp.]HVE20454.1 periplasmic heavy metal sensor [Acidocella sp.]
MTEQRSQTPNWRRIALPASLVLNLFFAALIGGHVWRDKMSESDAQPPLAAALAKVQATLSTPDAAAFTAVLHRDAPGFLTAAQQFDDARAQLAHQITAEPYNPEAVRQALAVWQVSWNHFMNDFSGPLVDALAQISPQGRSSLIAARRKATFSLGPP